MIENHLLERRFWSDYISKVYSLPVNAEYRLRSLWKIARNESVWNSISRTFKPELYELFNYNSMSTFLEQKSNEKTRLDLTDLQFEFSNYKLINSDLASSEIFAYRNTSKKLIKFLEKEQVFKFRKRNLPRSPSQARTPGGSISRTQLYPEEELPKNEIQSEYSNLENSSQSNFLDKRSKERITKALRKSFERERFLRRRKRR